MVNIYMDIKDRISRMGFEYIETREEGMVFKRSNYDKKIIIVESKDNRLKYELEVKLFEIWAKEEIHPFVALKNGKYYDLLFNELIDYI